MPRLPQDERKKRIVQAAMRAFARTGFRGTRTRDLAREAGVSEGLVFKYFPDKKSIQKAIIEERIRSTGPLVTEDLATLSPRNALRIIAQAMIARNTKDPDFMRLLYYSALEGEPLAGMLYRKRQTRGVGGLARLLKAWAAEGKVDRRIDPRFAAWLFVAGVYHLIVSRHIFGFGDFMDERGDLAEKAADLFFRGIGP